MSQLQNSQRSKSAPGALTSSAFDADLQPSTIPQPPLISTPASEGSQDAFNLEGAFFPRSNSYYALNTMNRTHSSESWVYGTASSTTAVDSSAEAITAPDLVPSTSRSTASSSPISTYSSFPRTPMPVAPMNLLDDSTLRRRIQSEDRVRGLALSALERVTELSFGRIAEEPAYDHDPIYHSYDALHDSFCEKRRSATEPNLAAIANAAEVKGSRGAVLDAHEPGMSRSSSGKMSLLFSPNEEEIDLFGEEDGTRKEVQEGDSWVTYIYASARRLWIRESTSTAPGSLTST